MPHIQRDVDGEINSLHRSQPRTDHGRDSDSADGAEYLPGDHPEVIAFLADGGAAATDFVRMDIDFVRVLEDVIDALLARNVINITDLPEQALDKLFARRSFRDRVTRRLSGIIDTES